MASIVLNCPNCRQPYQMSPEMIGKYAGRTITCRKCKQPFAFDAVMDAAARQAGEMDASAEESTAEADSSAAAEGAIVQYEQPAYAAPVAPPLPPRVPPAAPVAAPSFPSPPPPPAPAFVPQSYAPPAPAPTADYASNARTQGAGVGDLFTFKRMALPAMLPLLFWAGVAYCIYNAIKYLMSLVLVAGGRMAPYGMYQPLHVDLNYLVKHVMSVGGILTILDALFWLILGPLFWRGFCELILAASRLLEARQR